MTTILAGAQVSPSGEPGPYGGDVFPIGAIVDYCGIAEPAGWIFCYGQALARTGIYADLFAAIGVTFGAGDGTTTFNVPDGRGFVFAGRDNMGGNAAGRISTAVDGTILGANGGNEIHDLTVAEIPPHNHTYQVVQFIAGGYAPLGSGWYPNQPNAASGTTGGGQAHNNTQPTLIVNKIIKYAQVTVGPPLPGTGDVVGPNISVDGNIAVFDGTTGKVIRSGGTVRSLMNREYNAIGNSNFEVDQRRCGILQANIMSGFAVDRWYVTGAGTLRFSTQTYTGVEVVNIPGTNYQISNSFLRVTLTTAQASLSSGHYWCLYQNIEGPMFRELASDVHSVSLLVRSSVANLKFAFTLCDFDATQSIAYLCTLGTANAWTLLTIPNVPYWGTGVGFSTLPGEYGYCLGFALCAHSSIYTPAPGVWQNNQRYGVAGMDNFAAQPLGSTFDLAFVQHEPGSECTPLIDKPFHMNLSECQRYYQKTYSYGVVAGTPNHQAGECQSYVHGNQHPIMPIRFSQTMAKIPSITGWNPVNGGSDQLRDYSAGIDRGPLNSVAVGDSGFSGFANSGGKNASLSQQGFHWTASTNF